MPDYKRKHRSRFKSAPKVKKNRVNKNDYSVDIEMTPNTPKTSKQKMRVVKGKKLEQNRKAKFLACVLGFVALIFIVCQLIMPAGVVETVSNSIAVLGSGKYPLEFDSGNTISVVSKGSYYYVLTDTKITAVSNSGKLIFSYVHGYENPVLKTSSTRAMVFGQGQTGALIFNLNGLKATVNSKKDIINYLESQDKVDILKNKIASLRKEAKIEYIDSSFNPDEIQKKIKEQDIILKLNILLKFLTVIFHRIWPT